MNTAKNKLTLNWQDAQSKSNTASTTKSHKISISECIESWGTSQRYYLSRALECIASTGKYQPEVTTIQDALFWLKRAQVQRVWKDSFDRAIQGWELNEDLALALEYIFAAATADTAGDDIEAAIRCLENRLVFLNEIECNETIA